MTNLVIIARNVIFISTLCATSASCMSEGQTMQFMEGYGKKILLGFALAAGISVDGDRAPAADAKTAFPRLGLGLGVCFDYMGWQWTRAWLISYAGTSGWPARVCRFTLPWATP